MTSGTFSVNGRTYAKSRRPVVVICIDGSEPDYHMEAMAAGRMPWLSKVLEGEGTSWPAHCAMPALTNPNNVSIATGCPPSVHGISGNYIFDTELGEEVLMNDKRFLRVPTVFGAANEAGLDVVVVTAKDKLRRLLGAGLVEDGPSLDGSGEFVAPSRRGICFSAEKADRATVEDNGIGDVLELVGRPLPSVYSADLSEFALAAGLRIMETRGADLMYLSLTDYIQHKHAPGTEAANGLYEKIDHYAGRLAGLGATVVLTADHGMSAKTDDAGAARIIYVEEEVRRILAIAEDAEVTESDGLRVILPITDPYTVHHGALGSFASVYLPPGAVRASTVEALRAIEGVQEVHGREEAAERYALPPDRIGDIVVLAEAGTALGRFAAWHDLSGLDAPLRSHGALGELQIPFLINRRPARPDVLDKPFGDPARIHNYDALWVATTLLAEQESATAPTRR
ncbi:phosphonoacetate hydrolase [Streptomyces sp. NBC_00385]|uniref:phosphonoacetate hydrolase n=1 Tax=Streptomyces sp. NBC_00385 TaxID=2975733 RepID=UPI002DDB979E|nr:phosphonoacetate hydrolase [Streptomyces sp. NBC_00385]WRZ08772.1 phosphonoacetate hydrolase [Streptomyces sp. NBC_00385]